MTGKSGESSCLAFSLLLSSISPSYFLPIRRFDLCYYLDLGRNDLYHFSLMLRPITLFTVLRLGTANFKDLFVLCLPIFPRHYIRRLSPTNTKFPCNRVDLGVAFLPARVLSFLKSSAPFVISTGNHVDEAHPEKHIVVEDFETNRPCHFSQAGITQWMTLHRRTTAPTTRT